MKKKKVYMIVCSYHLEDGIRTITFKEALRSLGYSPILSFWETTEDFEGVIKYNVDRGYRVVYGIASKMVHQGYMLNHSLESQSDVDLKFVLDSVIYKIHDDLIENMDDYTFRRLYSNYGNDYSKQLRKRRY